MFGGGLSPRRVKVVAESGWDVDNGICGLGAQFDFPKGVGYMGEHDAQPKDEQPDGGEETPAADDSAEEAASSNDAGDDDGDGDDSGDAGDGDAADGDGDGDGGGESA